MVVTLIHGMSVLPGPCHPRLKKESSEEEPMQTDMGESPYIPGPGENPLYTAEPLTLDDLKLLSDLFYLPYEHGTTARTMLQELDWLKNQSQAAAAETDKVVFIFICKRRSFFYMLSSYSCFLFFQTAEWCSRAQQFDNMCEAVVQMFNRLSNAPNRSILYDLYNYICDIKSGVGLARAYVKTLGEKTNIFHSYCKPTLKDCSIDEDVADPLVAKYPYHNADKITLDKQQ